jgi:hypothetical protein
VANRSINLLDKQSCRAALSDETEPHGPEMSRVVKLGRLSRRPAEARPPRHR